MRSYETWLILESFIYNVIVETKKEERYNKVVEEIVKRLTENNLYIKLEKWRWYWTG